MIRRLLIILLLIALLPQYACKKAEANNNEARYYALNSYANKPVPEWIAKGTKVYGLVVFEQDGIPQIGKPVQCEVLDISVRGIKCKALEKVSLFDQFNCYKIGIEKDEIWYDVSDDLFKTKKEANQYLEKRNILLNLY